MSLENKQRAHDIAIASLPFIQKSYSAKSVLEDSDKYKFDIYKEYINSYNMILGALNRDFPNGMK